MVIDSSVLLSLIFAETHAAWSRQKLWENRHNLKMSTVNLAEVLIRTKDRQFSSYQEIRDILFSSPIQFIAPTTSQTEQVAAARMAYAINLGDCFAYALARQENCPILTLDPDFKTTDIPVIFPG